MCGLAGIFDSHGVKPVSHGLLTAMRDRLFHRGPDGAGDFLAPGIGLAHRRLAIVDLAGGVQPLFNETGHVVVVFNGEIYNFQDLRRELEGFGHIFSTNSDTEVIVHGWEQWGPDCVTHFSGMFAFALWDANQSTLMLARDRLGKKPLYYTEWADGMVLFGSELKALLASPQVSRAIDPAAIDDFLCYGYVPDPLTIYRGIAKLPPAHRLIWRRGDRPRLDCYWRLRMGEDGPYELTEAKHELLDRLRSAVATRMIADVPLGAFLSGGVDSSGVVAVMAGLSPKPVQTYCIAFDSAEFDESRHARLLADLYGTDHHVEYADSGDLSLIDRLPAIFDEPFGDASALPSLQVCKMARRDVTVALSGDGGDEIFAGYRRYVWHQREEALRRQFPDGLRRPLFSTLAAIYPRLGRAPRWLRARNTFRELAMDSAEAYCHSLALLPDSLRHHLYSDGFRRELQGYRAVDCLRRHMRDADSDNPLLQAQYADMKMWLAGDILVKIDRTSMAASLETRAPLLDHDLVEWAARLPARHKIHRGVGKFVLKRALQPMVPIDLLCRRKQGFSTPLAAWFRGPLAERIGQAAVRLGESGYFSGKHVADLVSEHVSGRCDHGVVLWSLLMFDGFLSHTASL